MNLLLLLSALLSALGGMGQAVRGGRAPEAVCASVATCAAKRIAAPSRAARPTVALPSLAALPAATGARWALAATEPAFASRRRE